MHDYALMKKVFAPGSNWFGKAHVWLDLGFLGADKDYAQGKIHLSHKKPRKSQSNPDPALSPLQKKQNRQQAGQRVVVEHAIGGMKIFHCLTHRIRNHLDNVVDGFFWLSAGLWNLKIS